jgi:hypothetical protein
MAEIVPLAFSSIARHLASGDGMAIAGLTLLIVGPALYTSLTFALAQRYETTRAPSGDRNP